MLSPRQFSLCRFTGFRIPGPGEIARCHRCVRFPKMLVCNSPLVASDLRFSCNPLNTFYFRIALRVQFLYLF